MGEGKFGAIQRLTRGRRARQPRKDPHSTPAMLGLFEEDATAAQREAVMLGAKLQRWTCFFSWQDRGIAGPAESFHRAGLALWAGTADQRAQFHKRGIVSASVPSRQELGGGGPEPLAASGRVDRGLDVEDPGKDASDICFYDWNRLVECEGGNGVCRVTADARKVQDRFHIFWKSAAVLFHDGDSSRAQIPGARVVAEPLPGVKDVVFGSGSERREIGKAPEPVIIIRDDGSDLGLLEHELGNEDRVGVVGTAPGKIARVLTVPGKEIAAERGGVRMRIHADGETSNA